MTTHYKVTELFCIIDEFCKHFDAEMQEIYLKTIAESSVDVAKRRCPTVKS